MKIAFVDTNRGSSSSHSIEARVGFTTVAHAMLERLGDEWWVYDVYTKPDYRGQGISKQIISHIEREYGPIVIESENDPFWEKMGYRRGIDGYWRKG
jgi:GNAT superfamily N-acetyltransferase